MSVITRFNVGVYAFHEFNGRLVIRGLRHKFAMNGEVKNFIFSLLDYSLQIIFSSFNNVNQRKPPFYFSYNAVLFSKRW